MKFVETLAVQLQVNQGTSGTVHGQNFETTAIFGHWFPGQIRIMDDVT
jgi:hypothetical protein